MNRVFNKLHFPAKLALLGLIPLVFLIYFALQIIHEKQQRVKIVTDVITNINNSIEVSKLAAELHLERRRSVRYVLYKASEPELIGQRTRTDAILSELEGVSDTSFNSYLQYSMLGQLEQRRNSIRDRQMTAGQVLTYYSNVLERVHSYYNASVNNIPYLQSVADELTSHRLMFNLMNQFGVLRAHIYVGSLKGKLSEDDLNTIEGASDLTSSYIEEFSARASKDVKGRFDQVINSKESRKVNQILSSLRSKGSFGTLSPEEWWNTSGWISDNLIKLQDHLMQTTREQTHALLQEERQGLYTAGILLVLIIILVIAVIAYTISNITGVLNNLRMATEKIALGETGIQLPILANDVIGSLSKSVKSIDINNDMLANAADAIGRGDFQISIAPRSANDVLGKAVVNMKEELLKYSIESSEEIWIQTGLSVVNDAIKGEKQVSDLSSDVLSAVVNYLEAQAGLLYSRRDDLLHFAAGYAINSSYSPPQTLELGETLLGETAKRNKPVYLEEVPDDFLKISSGSGESMPKYVLIIPLSHNDMVEGVIEIASFTAFSSSARELLEKAAQNIAIALHTAKNRAKLQELLEETQAQSEELQVQHSELENLNTELEAQAQKLQASEEELKVQQEELINANQELELKSSALEEKNQLIVERNLEIQKKAEELEISTRYKSEFLANMSHELRTPLNSILLLSRLMYENPEDNLTSEQIEYARVIQSSGNGLLALIDEILDLSKIEAGKMELEYSDVLISDVAGDLKALFAPIAKDKNLLFETVVEPGTQSRINIDRMRLEQILKNLLSNALKFTSAGSVRLVISQSADPSMISFSVKDTGIGIPGDKQQHIFEAFQQADGSTKRKFGGTGLGLSISRELARLLGGEITLKSDGRTGSEFILEVPVAQRDKKTESTIPQEEKNEERPSSGTETSETKKVNYLAPSIPEPVSDDREELAGTDKIILIVEDDTDFAKALLKYTRKAGYKGIVAVRGDEGIELAVKHQPLAILLDIQLPVKDGWEVMEELKAKPETRHIPVHIMSSLAVKRESLLKGAVDFINKPIALEQMQRMFSRLEEVLSKHPKKVLIVEENHKHAKALAYFLESFSVNTEIKGSVSEGIESLQKNDAECVILDMGVPDNSVYDTLENIKKSEGLEDVPIIVFTGRSISKNEETRLKYYADSIVMKTAHSYQRILDEVALFLHVVEEKNAAVKNPSVKHRNLPELTEILNGKTVLVADDDVRNIFAITKSLEQLKMKILSATDGREAIKVLEENPQTDVVLMDMMMPEMDGYESISAIRRNPKYKQLPILAVTAKAMVGDREKCIKAGASDYISKPVDIDQLISLLRVWLYDKSNR